MARVKWFLHCTGQSLLKVYFITSCLDIWLFSLCIGAISAQDNNITCSVPPVQLHQDTVLTCHFPEDISVTKKDFNVYHYNKGADSDAVVDCWWMSGNIQCVVLPGYDYNKTVNTELTVTIRNVTSSHTGIYACQVTGYPTNSFVTCQFNTIQVNSSSETERPQSGSEMFKPVVIGLSVGLTITMLIVGLLFILKRKRIIRFCKRGTRKKEGGEVNTSLISNVHCPYRKTKEFEEYLETRSREMYANILNSFYFVPPVYFNKTKGSAKYVADQTIYVYTCPDPNDYLHDKAMQQVILCLREVEEKKLEEMFLLTQFSFDDYLNNTCHDYEEHRLPMPDGVEDFKKEFEYFHFLIIHRHKGVLVGMVYVANETPAEGMFQRNKQKQKPVDLSQHIKRLGEACRVVKHLMSDQPDFPEIRKVFILFNDACLMENRSDDFIQNENITFCYGRLPDANSSWTVDSSLAEQLSTLLNSQQHETQDVRMSDNIYLKMISRFCGPATISTLIVDSESYILPKTLDEAVSMTGNLFERLTLYPGMIELLSERQVCLAGPPCTGKTKMLALVGKKWLSEGHDVHIISSYLGSAISRQLMKILKPATESQSLNLGNVILVPCDSGGGEESIRKAVSRIKKISEEKPVFIIIDERQFQNLGLKGALHRLTDEVTDKVKVECSNIKSKFRRSRTKSPMERFIQETDALLSFPVVAVGAILGTTLLAASTALHDKDQAPSVQQFPQGSSSGIHIWVAGCCFNKTSVSAPYYKNTFLWDPLSCPPSVLREMFAKNISLSVKPYSYNRYPPPTDGPPVLHIRHEGPCHPESTEPSDCTACGNELKRLFTNALRLTGAEQSIIMEPKASMENSNVKSKREPLPLQFSDLLLLFENDIDNDTPIIKILVAADIPVLVINHENQLNALETNENTAIAANARLLWGIKRKIVVFVEGMERSEFAEWIKLRGITSCTSQLVMVERPARFNTVLKVNSSVIRF